MRLAPISEARYPVRMVDELRQHIRDVPDFPKPGIIFKDITPLLRNAAAFRRSVDALAETSEREGWKPDVCAGPEARGFIFAAALAQRIGTGFVPIRKPGKLPSLTTRVEYDLEYGQDAIEMHDDAVTSGQRVLLVDDVLATGGTIRACTELIEQKGGVVCGILFALEIEFLSGRSRLGDYPARSLLNY